jgi:aminoglycoside 3-N-acetyltransferase I
MEIRRLGEEEVELLEAALRDLLPPEDLPRGPASRPHLTRALADRACYFLVCIVDNAPVAYLSAYRFPAAEHDGFMVYLYDIVVRPEHRRRGIATGLLEVLKQCCRADGVTRIWRSGPSRPLERGTSQRPMSSISMT